MKTRPEYGFRLLLLPATISACPSPSHRSPERASSLQATCAEGDLELTCDVPELANLDGWSLDIRGAFAYRNQQVAVSGEITRLFIEDEPAGCAVLPEGRMPAGPAGSRPPGGPGRCRCRGR